MIKNLATLVSLAVILSSSFVLSTQSVWASAKNSQNGAHKAKSLFVPPPPPYTPSIGLTEMGMVNAQMDAFEGGNEKSGNLYSKHVFGRELPQLNQSGSTASHDPVAETKVQKHIDTIDSEISGIQKEIGKLLNL